MQACSRAVRQASVPDLAPRGEVEQTAMLGEDIALNAPAGVHPQVTPVLVALGCFGTQVWMAGAVASDEALQSLATVAQ